MGFPATLQAARQAIIDQDQVCELDPRELTRLPGVWLRVDALVGPTLCGMGTANRSKVQVTVFCIVKPLDPLRDFLALESLVNAVAAVIPPMSDVRHVALQLPGGGTPAPALSYTHDLIIGETD